MYENDKLRVKEGNIIFNHDIEIQKVRFLQKIDSCVNVCIVSKRQYAGHHAYIS